jgi:acetyl esterase/lipase
MDAMHYSTSTPHATSRSLLDRFGAIPLSTQLCAGLLLTAAAAGALPGPAVSAAEPVRMLLWPDRPDGSNGAPGARGEAEGDRPHLRIYHAPAAQAQGASPVPAVVVVPGGGYGALADGHEGTEIAAWLNELGATAAVCMYRHRRSGAGYGYPHPIQDVQRAITLVRSHAADWNLDPHRLGVIGFSAGGHLVTSVCTTDSLVPPGDAADQLSTRPDFAVVCYPVIAFGAPHTHLGSQRNLLGEGVSAERLAELSTHRRVSPQTPPTFLWHTAADRVVPAQNAIDYFQALLAHQVPSALHIFERGRHGLGLAQPRGGERALPASQWPELCATWLQQHGFLDRPAASADAR